MFQKILRFVKAHLLAILLVGVAGWLAGAFLLLVVLDERKTRYHARRSAEVLGTNPENRLRLGRLEAIAGTDIVRGELIRMTSVLDPGSEPYREVRNILFMDPESREARWLLTDDDHVITDRRDIEVRRDRWTGTEPVATVALVKPEQSDLSAEGALLLFDLAGRHVQTVAERVRAVHATTLDEQNRVVLVFERRNKYVFAVFDRESLQKLREQEWTVPPLQ